MAAVLWPGAVPAAGPIEEVLSLVAQERYEQARKKLAPLVLQNPSGPRVRLTQGILRAREGRAGEAITIFERLRDDHPDMFEPYNNLAVLYADQDRLEAARDALIAALERRPDAVVYVNLGDVYARLARRAYAHARELRAKDEESDAGAGKVSTVPLPSSRPQSDTSAPVEEPLAAPRPKATNAAIPEPEPPGAPDTPGNLAAAPLSLHGAGSRGECVRASAFADRGAATEAAQWMQARGAEIVGIGHRQRQVVSGYWVYLPARPSRGAAEDTVDALHAKGVRDVGIVRKGGRSNVISLGLYGEEANMRRRVARLKALGFSPEVSTTGKNVGAYAVTARAGTARAAFDGPWKTRFPGHPIQYIDCPTRG